MASNSENTMEKPGHESVAPTHDAKNAQNPAEGEHVGQHASQSAAPEGRPIERQRTGARGTAAMDPETRQEVARKGGLAVSRNKQHMAEIGRKGGQTVSKNREHMAAIGRKGGEASRGRG